MIRRDFIKVTGLAGGTILVMGAMDKQTLFAEMEDKSIQNSEDFRLSLLKGAMKAPSSHNTQPWLVDLKGQNSLDLYVDRERLLPKSDPFARQIHISQGCFLEILQLTATKIGYQSYITYFPIGEYGNYEWPVKPVARVNFEETEEAMANPFTEFISLRQTNKRDYDRSEISDCDLLALQESVQDDSNFMFIRDEAKKSEIAELLTEAMAIEVQSKERNKELLKWFRFNDDELREHRDGFGIGSSGNSGFKKWIIEKFFLDREKAIDPEGSFSRSAVKQAEGQAKSASAFLVQFSNNNTRLDQVKAGHSFVRLQLKAAALGLFIHPMNQVTQEYEELVAIASKFKKIVNVQNSQIVQIVARIGRAKRITNPPRRNVEEILM